VQGKIHSRIATADANVLAGGGAGAGTSNEMPGDGEKDTASGPRDMDEIPRDEL
jgi:hypothetical protein